MRIMIRSLLKPQIRLACQPQCIDSAVSSYCRVPQPGNVSYYYTTKDRMATVSQLKEESQAS